MRLKQSLYAGLAVLLASSCDGGGLSTADVQEGAKSRVRAELGLSEEAALFTETFVGEPLDGDITICGRVSGTRSDGTVITPRRFIAAADPGRWVKFEPVTDSTLSSHQNKFVEWVGTCLPRQEDVGMLG
jgi:hypothetical protein